MNITLVQPNLAKLPSWLVKYHILPKNPFPPSPPLGLLLVAAFVENQGHKVNVFDNSVEELSHIGLVKEIFRTNPDIVGFHTTSLTYPNVRAYLELIKQENKEIITVAGGPLATFYPERIAENSNIDFVIRNEGEITLSELLKSLENGKDLSSIKGLTYKEKDKIIHNKQRPFIEDLDSLPFPARHLIDMSKYHRRELFFKAYPTDALSTSRGCPYDCQFCSSTRYMFCRTYRNRSAENVVDEMEMLKEKYGTKGLYFREDLFTVNKKRLFAICDEMAKRKIDLPWICESRVDTVSKEKLEKMKSAGCTAIWFGCESGSQKVLDMIKKEITVSQIEDTFKWCKEIGIITGAAFIVGFPCETVEDTNKTIELAKKIRSNYSWIRIYIGSPRSPIYDEVIEKKYYRKDCKWEGVVGVETPELPLETIVSLRKKIEKEFNKITIRRVFSDFFAMNESPMIVIKNVLNLGKYLVDTQV